jgi:hypothetical protein
LNKNFMKIYAIFCIFPYINRKRKLTWVGGADGGSATEVTSRLSLSISLEIAIGSIRTVRNNSIWVITNPILYNWRAISSSSTCVIYSFLESRGTLVRPAHAPKRIYANILKTERFLISYFLKIFRQIICSCC